MKKNLGAKIVASIGLLGIIVSVIGTGILALLSGNSANNVEQNTELTQEQLKDLIKNYSTGTTSSGTENINTGTTK